MTYPAFDYDTKQLRKAAIAELEALEDIRDQWRNRPLGTYNPASERSVEDTHMQREQLARHALTSTARSYMDSCHVCEWRAKVREQIRMARAYQNAYTTAPESESSNRDMARYYRTHRVPLWLQGYRRAIAHARPEIAA